ncbi:MAG: acetate--CoA ligase family protein [Deltaproteobacteria bacterium]|nr:acetate--CoA ligase family protein [Deltaproteobacteria bacterium]
MTLDALFKPKSVAVIGASNRRLTIGYRIIQNLLDHEFNGPIFPVHPKEAEIKDLPAFPSILDVPEQVDLAHIVVKSTLVPRILGDCANKGVKAVIINTAGFKEVGGAGIELENQIVQIAKDTGIRLFGPNCQGVMNTDPDVRAYCNFTFTRLLPGHISLFAQSGGVGEVVHNRLYELEAGIRMYASPGNSCAVAVPEILKYWGDDPETRVIICHVESLADPQAFFEVAREVAAKKPILGMKTGRTQAGAKAVSSHTGGLMKQDTTTELIFEEAGVISISDQEELCQAALAFARQPVPKGNRVGIITNTGGPGIICTDEVIEAGCQIPDLSADTQAVLKEVLYDEAIVSNPVDVIATAGPDHWKAAVEGLIADPNIDSILLNFITPFFVDCEGVAKEIAALAPTAGKPIIGVVMTEKAGWKTTLETFQGAGIPTYDFPETGARALAAMSRYAMRSARPASAPERPAGIDRDKAAAIINASAESGRSFVPQALAFQMLAAYGIGAPSTEGMTDLDGVKAAAAEIGYPVVLKVDSEAVVHKSDAGGVSLNLKDEQELEAAFGRMNDAFGDKKPAYLVSQFVCGDREVILGAKREPGLGHVLVFGLGGILVEVLGDAAFALAPTSTDRALEVIRSIKGFKVLEGVRGQAPADIDLLADALVRLGWLVADNPRIEELDLNPVFAFEKGKPPVAVDVRIKISS